MHGLLDLPELGNIVDVRRISVPWHAELDHSAMIFVPQHELAQSLLRGVHGVATLQLHQTGGDVIGTKAQMHPRMHLIVD